MYEPKNILVIRNDKLGDFMLIWPALALLKASYPDTRITSLVPSYTKPMAEICPWIDDCITDEQHNSVISDALYLKNKITRPRFDASISFFTETRTALATRLARIPMRVAPATKIAQIFSNSCLRQRRSQSAKPEHEYNTDLVRYFIHRMGDTAATMPNAPYLTFDQASLSDIKQQFHLERDIPSDQSLIIIHPGSGGSAINLTTQQYADLIDTISEAIPAHFIITAGPGEENTARDVASLLTKANHSIYLSSQGIVTFSQFIATADLFISGSTGTLHIAGALNVPTAAFYPARKSATPLRWQTLNSKNRRISFSPTSYNGENDMMRIDIQNCSQQIIRLFHHLKLKNDSSTTN